MTDLWVARDADGDLGLFLSEPEFDAGCFFGERVGCILNPTRYPNLKPGECRRLVMEKEASE